ncbi:MAG TPA: hypothetical protein VNZ49_08315 [Bacteroidia bacterium]|jgi:hypothetical protein|nr:hypothetical protein [Bacteroidia bacterium]
MDKQNEHLETLTEIRSMMERSSRFISLSGLSGVFAGIFALAGAFVAYKKLVSIDILNDVYRGRGSENPGFSFYTFFIVDALCVLIASLAVGCILTMRKAKRQGLPVWDNTAKRLFINLFIPLAAGGIFCLILLYHGLMGLVAPATLLFYGLALLNAGKYTLHDIRTLGICQIILGLLSSVFVGYGLFFWAFGFGVLHIIYGTLMYYKYEK